MPKALIDVADLHQRQPEDQDDVVVRVDGAPVVALARKRELAGRLEHNVIEGTCVRVSRARVSNMRHSPDESQRPRAKAARSQHAPNAPARNANIAGRHFSNFEFFE